MSISIRETNSSYKIYQIEQMQEEENQFLSYQYSKKVENKKYEKIVTQKNIMAISKSLDSHIQKPKLINQHKRCKTLQKDIQNRQLIALDSLNKPSFVLLPKVIHATLQNKANKHKINSFHKNALKESIKYRKQTFFNEIFLQKSCQGQKPQRIINMGVLNCSNIFLSKMNSQTISRQRNLPISKKQLKKLIMIRRAGSIYERFPNLQRDKLLTSFQKL